jgi:hypothetical protein
VTGWPPGEVNVTEASALSPGTSGLLNGAGAFSRSEPPPEIAMSTPRSFGIRERSSDTLCRCDVRMTMPTPRLRSFSISNWMVPTRSGSTRTLRGLEIAGSSGVVAPTMPTRCPQTCATTLPTMRRCRARRSSAGSRLTSRLALTKGVRELKPPMNLAVTSGPKSNSWLPTALAV